MRNWKAALLFLAIGLCSNRALALGPGDTPFQSSLQTLKGLALFFFIALAVVVVVSLIIATRKEQ